ncbi:MAG: glycosyltransferase, partial [Proteobacteria bacterium]
WNAEETIAETLRSVASQTGVPDGLMEHLLIDGGSTDKTLEIIRSFPNVKWMSERDGGIADAFNKGVKLAKGKWIQILNADDALAAPTVISEILKHLDSSYDFIYGRAAVMDEALIKCHRTMGSPDGWKFLSRRMTVPHPALFSQKRVFDEYGYFDTSYKIAMDYEWILRSFRRLKFKYVPITVSLFRSGGASSAGLSLKQAKECWRAKAKNSVGTGTQRAGWFVYQSVRTIFDYLLPRIPVVGFIYNALTASVRRPH